MKGKRRSPSEIARDRRNVASRYLQGKLQAEIAEELEVSQSSVSRDLKAIQKLWLASSLIDFNEAKARELAEIDHLERVYWKAWAVSCKARTGKSVKAKGTIQREITNPDGTVTFVQESPAEQTVRTEDRIGDPRFLQGVRWCIDQRCKIIGVYAPTKIAPTDPTGEHEYSGFSDSELVREVTRLVDAARTREAAQADGDDPV